MSRRPPPDSAGRVLLEFQAVMQQFLRVEQAVLRAHRSRPVLPSRNTVSPLTFSGRPVALPEPVSAAQGDAAAAVVAEPPEAPVTSGGTPPSVAGGRSLRLTLRALERPRLGTRAMLARDRVILITDDRQGVAAALADRLRQDGHRVVLVTTEGSDDPPRDACRSSLDSPVEVERLVGLVTDSCGPIGALLHLIPLGNPPNWEDLDFASWSRRLSLETRTLFLLTQALRPALAAAASEGGAAVLVATAMGGAFGSDAAYAGRSFFPGHGGVVGFAKSLGVEWPTVRVRAVDLDPVEPASSRAELLFDELWAADAEPEVGHVAGQRLGLALDVTPPIVDPAFSLPSDAVVLATGGARGITAEVCLELADRYQLTFVLVGQNVIPQGPEARETAGLSSPSDLKRALMSQLASDGTRMTVAMVEQAYRQLLKDREIRETIGRLTAAGARVHYVSLDVRDQQALGALIDDIYSSYGRLDGVIHGAGIIEDKLV